MKHPTSLSVLSASIIATLLLPQAAQAAERKIQLKEVSAPSEVALLKRLYAKEIQEIAKDQPGVNASTLPVSFSTAELDLNGGGIKDMIVQFHTLGTCCSSGCTVNVWIGQKNGGWKKVMEAIGGTLIFMPGNKTKGYMNIKTKGKVEKEEWKWNGTEYMNKYMLR